jgi:hypothetical protein
MDSVVQVCGEESVAEQVKMIHGFHLKEPLTLIIHCDACSLNLGCGATSGGSRAALSGSRRRVWAWSAEPALLFG